MHAQWENSTYLRGLLGTRQTGSSSAHDSVALAQMLPPWGDFSHSCSQVQAPPPTPHPSSKALTLYIPLICFLSASPCRSPEHDMEFILVHRRCSISAVQLLSHALLFGDPMDNNPPGSSVHGILQVRILEWVAISFSRGIFLL